MALGFVTEPEKTEEELTKERQQSYIAALIYERDGYQRRLDGATEPEDVKFWQARVNDVKVELAKVSDTAEIRSKGIRK